MDIIRFLTGRKEKPFSLSRINTLLGPWRPFNGTQSECLPGTRLPQKIRWRQRKFLFCHKDMELDFVMGILTHWLRLRPKMLRFVAYYLRDAEKYKCRELPRKNKAPRKIEEPIQILKFIQRRILTRILMQTDDLPDPAHGFVRGRSTATAAAPHQNQPMVVCCDLRDFFPSISKQRVWGIFRSLIIHPRISNLLAELTTFQGRLPQGAPTSPMLANLVVRRMDRRLAGIARARGITYTRYADDMIFSGDTDTLKMIPAVRAIAKEEGFSLAEEKTRILRRGRRQKVCGLVVNEKVGVPRRWRRRLRAEIHNISTGKSFDPARLPHIQGKLAYMQHLHPEETLKLKEKLLASLNAIKKSP